MQQAHKFHKIQLTLKNNRLQLASIVWESLFWERDNDRVGKKAENINSSGAPEQVISYSSFYIFQRNFLIFWEVRK